MLSSLSQADFSAFLVQDPVREPARSRASSPVAAPSSQKTGDQAAPRIGIAHSAVDETFYFYRFFPLNGPDLLQGEFPGRNDPADSEFL